jgi:hypothetical protein
MTNTFQLRLNGSARYNEQVIKEAFHFRVNGSARYNEQVVIIVQSIVQ